MKLARPVLFLVALTALAGFRSDETYTLKQLPVKGEEQTVSIEMHLTVEDTDMTIEGKSHSKVTIVNDDGSYEQEETNLESKQTVNGEVQELGKQEPKIVKYDKNGKRIKAEDEPDDPLLNALKDVFDSEPVHAVKIGESWTHDGEYGSATMQLVGPEKVGDVDCLKLTMKGSLSKKDSAGDGEGTIYLRAKDFRMEKAEMKIENLKIGEGPVIKKIEVKSANVPD